MTTPSTAILCIVRNEIPYLSEWLEHHIGLGFDCIYIISTDQQFSDMTSWVSSSQFSSNIELYHFDNLDEGWQFRCYQQHFKYIKEDWVMVLDADEFLYLNTYKSIHGFLSQFDDEVGQIQFPWLNLTTSDYSHNNTFDILNQPNGYASDHVKSIVRRKHVQNMFIHSHAVGNKKNLLSSGSEAEPKNKHNIFVHEPSYYQHHPCILHFTSRGYFDVMVRIIDHKFFNAKSGNPERLRLSRLLLEDANLENLPNRFLLSKIHQSLPPVKLNFRLPQLQSSTNKHSLYELFLLNIQRIIDFDCSDPFEFEQEFENKFQLQSKIESVTVPKCNIDEYLNCQSQIQYASKLRKQQN